MLLLYFRCSPALAKPILEFLEALDELAHAAGGGRGHDYLRIQEADGRRQAAESSRQKAVGRRQKALPAAWGG
jgi:hypothetical protein